IPKWRSPSETQQSDIAYDIHGEHRQRDEEHRDPAAVRRDNRPEEEDRDRRETPVFLPELRGHDPDGGEAVHEHGELEREPKCNREQEDEVDETVAVQDEQVRAEEILNGEEQVEGEWEDDDETQEDAREE